MYGRHFIVALAGIVATAAAVLPAADAQQAAQPAAEQAAAGQPTAGQPPADQAAGPASNGEPSFNTAFMSNPENIKGGEVIWAEQCRHCHGASAYPGKAPKINPVLLEPDFIFDRVTNGFQKMPPWKDVFSEEQRMNVVAYIKSKQFSP
jgi:mono/diheme cytochrome c family protein